MKEFCEEFYIVMLYITRSGKIQMEKAKNYHTDNPTQNYFEGIRKKTRKNAKVNLKITPDSLFLEKGQEKISPFILGKFSPNILSNFLIINCVNFLDTKKFTLISNHKKKKKIFSTSFFPS